MQSLDGACGEFERANKKLKIGRSSLPLLLNQKTTELATNSTTSSTQSLCIFTKLLELYKEESSITELKNYDQNKTGLKRNSYILEKLVMRERLNTLILNLYADNKGYSLAFRTLSRRTLTDDTTANMIETKQWPYEEDELLDYINKERIPPYLTQLLTTHYSFLFYNGCIIVEVRDYRQIDVTKCDIYHILLRPTFESTLADINNIIKDKIDWNNEERQELESEMLLANNPTLCLDPNNKVSLIQSKINHNRQLWNTFRCRKSARKFTINNRKRQLEKYTYKPGLELYNYLTRVRMKPKINNEIKPIPIPNFDLPITTTTTISPPTQGVNIKELFKSYKRPEETSDCLPQLVEEYILETDMSSKERGKQRVYHIKLSILQRPSNSEYLGELYLDRDYKKNERNGVACRFSLGTRINANRYIHQFTEIFTENGRKSVRIRYGMSPEYKEKVAMAQAQAQIQAQNAQAQASLSHHHQQQQQQLSIQNQSCSTQQPIVNGRISLVQQNQSIQNTSNVPILLSHLQGTAKIKTTTQISNEKSEIDALAADLKNSVQQFEATAKQQQLQQQQQKLASNRRNTAIINLTNSSSTVSNINSDATILNTINNTPLIPHQQLQTLNQKLARKMTLSNVTNARVLNHSNLIALNSNRMNLNELNQTQQQQQQQQGQTITLTSVNSGGNYTNYVPLKQQVINQQILTNNILDNNNKSTLSPLLVGATSSADRSDLLTNNTNINSLLNEKFTTATTTTNNNNTTNQQQNSQTHFLQDLKTGQQYMIQSPKSNTTATAAATVISSPLSSPPSSTQNTSNTINVQSLNFVQVQIPGMAQPISLNVSSTNNLQGHPTSLFVSLPVTTSSSTANTITQTTGGVNLRNNSANLNSIHGVSPQTVVLANANSSNLAQLVSSGVKGLSQQTLQSASGGPTGVSLSQTGQPYQVLTPLQRSRIQQTGIQQNRTIQTPITIKMASPNSNVASGTLPSSNMVVTNQLQKQVQLPPQYQQLCMNQQQSTNVPNIAGILRRHSNISDKQ